MRHALTLALTLLAPTFSSAATFVVTKEADDNGSCTPDDCALREAILAANSTPELDLIELPAGVYELSLAGPVDEDLSMNGDLDVHAGAGVEIRGPENGMATIVAAAQERLLDLSGVVVHLSNLTLTGGRTAGDGGAIRASHSVLTLAECGVQDSWAGGAGGALYAAPGSVMIERSTVSGNVAEGDGGGIYFAGGGVAPPAFSLRLVNSTVSGNKASSGGAVYNVGEGGLVFSNATIVENTADDGVAVWVGDGNLISRNTIIAGLCSDTHPAHNSDGGNLESPGSTCGFLESSDQVKVVDLLLGPLADNGGSTVTHALLLGSPAIDAGLNPDCPAQDQRGVARPLDGDSDLVARCDVGAFEAFGLSAEEIPSAGVSALVVLASLLAAAGVAFLRS